MTDKNAWQLWIDGGFRTSRRARAVVTSLYGICVLIILSGIALAVQIMSDADRSYELKQRLVVSDLLGTAVTVLIIGAVAVALDMLRFQTEAVLFSEDEDDDDGIEE